MTLGWGCLDAKGKSSPQDVELSVKPVNCGVVSASPSRVGTSGPAAPICSHLSALSDNASVQLFPLRASAPRATTTLSGLGGAWPFRLPG